MKTHEFYMRRCLELARMGEIGAHPNPMVGAVIVDSNGAILGEGYHRRCGQAHAEVNAVANADARGNDITDSTIYVSLEPCSHWGKTPPCSKLIIDRQIPRVVVGCIDPFAKVQGRGIEMLREAGVEVTVLDGEISEACRELNRRFFTAHTLGRPFVALKWAETANGLVDRLRSDASTPPLRISTPESQIAAHRYRSTFDAIAVGRRTAELDRPRLDSRCFPGGRDPQRVEFRRGDLLAQLRELYAGGISSVLIEGGPTLQRAFIEAGLVDELRVERSPLVLDEPGVEAPLKLNLPFGVNLLRTADVL
ncbi:MAG: bifunctional diaminohydroxyphosphoribosylaminopyrimidine deaminase/5-amino-6-(5-phosphoribosylamino)uracil reductase RibD [Muribaculaceae bacterium]|nr:bifunctional diaminohydroxyphosphoribosylaminopyrimidine deaminase/5-amino-6-(5-phosphoribosylamino)uracil reductase RibD [Muribaculaceae bacterium]